MGELTQEQQIAGGFISSSLQPDKRDAFDNSFKDSKAQWRAAMYTRLKSDTAFANDQERQTKLGQLEAELDRKIIERTQIGALSTNSKKPTTAEEQTTHNGVMHLIDKAMEWVGGIFSMIWEVVKALMPQQVSDWVFGIKEQFMPTTPEEKRSRVAAGVVASLSQPINIGGVGFALDQNAQNQLYSQLQEIDFAKPSAATVASSGTTPAGANPATIPTASIIPPVIVPGSGVQNVPPGTSVASNAPNLGAGRQRV